MLNNYAKPLNEPVTEQEVTKNWLGDIDKPIVTIICHTYQHASYIKDALNGFLSQKTNFPFEIILRDDASKDGTALIVKEYSSKYPSIIRPLLETENQYSKGVKPSSITFPKARGKYIAFCEGDDYWCDPNKLQIQVDYLEENGECVITYHDTMSVDAHHKIFEASAFSGHFENYSQYKLLRGARMPNLTRCFRNVINEFPEEFFFSPAGDVFIATLLGAYGHAKYLDNIKPAAYRMHDGGIWAGVGNNKRRIDLAVSFYWIAVYQKRVGMLQASRSNTLSAVSAISRHLQLGIIKAFKLLIYLMFKK